MAELPKHVIAVARALSRDPSHDLCEIAGKLIADSPELVTMWRTLERWTQSYDDLWVWAFLQTAADASNLPPFHYKPAKERRELSDMIANWASRLAETLEVNGLDAHLIHNNGKLFNGFFLYEDFGHSNQARIDADGTNKLKISLLVKRIAERAQQKIADEPLPGKVGANARAIRFIRIVAARNSRWYGKSLNAATATAANAIFATSYQESDIVNLLSR